MSKKVRLTQAEAMGCPRNASAVEDGSIVKLAALGLYLHALGEELKVIADFWTPGNASPDRIC
ncbi:hypothetical protein OUY22_28010 [Nonomuraea sp. MCN248]|uniref:Transposase n=1 Tax=Nonomuraea corallina TaxID=2989783 RepID=A0ABT4SJ78_9ACTN|nr:hypothetical protein [Nonomuraea corallina]MDA0637266.1 hypothetical protein [Nonomuraea corallina]